MGTRSTNDVNEIIDVNNTPIDVNSHLLSPIDEPIEYDRLRGRDDGASEASRWAYYNSHSRFHKSGLDHTTHELSILSFL